MPWWTKVAERPIEKHGTLLDAAIRINFAVNVGGVGVAVCGIYARDPAAHPEEPNVLPAHLARVTKAAKRARRARSGA